MHSAKIGFETTMLIDNFETLKMQYLMLMITAIQAYLFIDVREELVKILIEGMKTSSPPMDWPVFHSEWSAFSCKITRILKCALGKDSAWPASAAMDITNKQQASLSATVF